MDRRVTLLVVLMLALGGSLAAQSLRGSHEKMERQHSVADSSDYPFLQTPAEVEEYARLGILVEVDSSQDLRLSKVSFAVARPEVRLFLRQLARQYDDACGEPLVVTSLTRPVDEQPENASELSVHPAGMAVDLRRSPRRACRRWLERRLLALQQQGVLDPTLEHRPWHYHVALYPHRYMALVSDSGAFAVADTAPAPRTARLAAAEGSRVYRVQRGDTLMRIAERHGISVRLLKRMNGLRGSRIAPGQLLRLPAT